jgi:hypothetical protein
MTELHCSSAADFRTFFPYTVQAFQQGRYVGLVAQAVECMASNHGVGGSNFDFCKHFQIFFRFILILKLPIFVGWVMVMDVRHKKWTCNRKLH